jgi:uncharacterized protein (DUF2147 family)
MRLTLPRHSFALFLLIVFALPTPTPALAASGAGAAVSSPVGRWKTIDDHTGQTKAIVNIRDINGTLEGRIVKLFDPPAPDPLCLKCTGTLKNKPVMGMRILWGMRKAGNEWTGGQILDPESGNIYRCTITLDSSGNVLRVRGYIGVSIFGRTETWRRAGALGTR